MNRKTFFKKLFLGAAAVVVAPKVIAEATKPFKRTGGVIPFIAGADPYKMDSKVHITDIRKYPLTYRECLSPEEILRIRKQTEDLIYIYYGYE